MEIIIKNNRDSSAALYYHGLCEIKLIKFKVILYVKKRLNIIRKRNLIII